MSLGRRHRSVLVRIDDGRLLGAVDVARSFRARLRGWMGRAPRPGDPALWLAGVRHVHTAWLAAPIDVLALAADGTVLGVHRRLPPWRMVLGPPGSRHALELPAGEAARLGLQVGQRLGVREARDLEWVAP